MGDNKAGWVDLNDGVPRFGEFVWAKVKGWGSPRLFLYDYHGLWRFEGDPVMPQRNIESWHRLPDPPKGDDDD